MPSVIGMAPAPHGPAPHEMMYHHGPPPPSQNHSHAVPHEMIYHHGPPPPPQNHSHAVPGLPGPPRPEPFLVPPPPGGLIYAGPQPPPPQHQHTEYYHHLPSTLPPQPQHHPHPHYQQPQPVPPHIRLALARVLYLGSAVPLETAVGLESVQNPLKERYDPDSDHNFTGIDCVLRVVSNGVALENVLDKSVAFFHIRSLHVAAAVKCIRDQGEEPRFVAVDTPEGERSTHPPIFACIMRRTKGIKVLECHAFITKSDVAALALVQAVMHAYEHKEMWRDDPPPVESMITTRLVAAEPPKPRSEKEEKEKATPEFYKPPPPHGYFYTSNKSYVRNYSVKPPQKTDVSYAPSTCDQRPPPPMIMGPPPFAQPPFPAPQPLPPAQPPPPQVVVLPAPAPPQPPQLPPQVVYVQQPPSEAPAPAPMPRFGMLPYEYYADWDNHGGQALAVFDEVQGGGYPQLTYYPEEIREGGHRYRSKDRKHRSKTKYIPKTRHRSKSNHRSKSKHRSKSQPRLPSPEKSYYSDSSSRSGSPNYRNRADEYYYGNKSDGDAYYYKDRGNKTDGDAYYYKDRGNSERDIFVFQEDRDANNYYYDRDRRAKTPPADYRDNDPYRRHIDLVRDFHDTTEDFPNAYDRREEDDDLIIYPKMYNYDYDYFKDTGKQSSRRRRTQANEEFVEYSSNFQPEIYMRRDAEDRRAASVDRIYQADDRRYPRGDREFAYSIREERRAVGDVEDYPDPYQLNDYRKEFDESRPFDALDRTLGFFP